VPDPQQQAQSQVQPPQSVQPQSVQPQSADPQAPQQLQPADQQPPPQPQPVDQQPPLDIEPAPSPPTYEYMAVNVDVGMSLTDLTVLLNNYGAEGWLLSQAFPRGNVPGAAHVAIFLREAVPDEPDINPDATS
jgi:hypothetical protein